MAISKTIHYRHWHTALIIVSLLMIQATGVTQTFNNNSNQLPIPTFYSWLQKAVGDMNVDGRDDIIVANQMDNFYIFLQQGNGSFIEKSIDKVQPFTPLSVIIADLDNNGYNDVLTGDYYNGICITRLPKYSLFTQASALANLNNYGWLDAFVCNDDSANGIWRNRANGNFVEDKMSLNSSTISSVKCGVTVT